MSSPCIFTVALHTRTQKLASGGLWFIPPGQPWRNPVIESCNGRLRWGPLANGRRVPEHQRVPVIYTGAPQVLHRDHADPEDVAATSQYRPTR